MKFLIAGAGFSGCVLAHQLVTQYNCSVEIWDERNHIGGNCHTYRDDSTQIMVHAYGPHIFHTDNKQVWDFINQFGELKPYVHRVKANSNGNIYPLPVNLQTINLFFNKHFSPAEARAFIEEQGDSSISSPSNFEEQALHYLGASLYQAFFYGYTKKQWGCEPAELPASILKRLPVRFNYNDNYHKSLYTGIPAEGYTAIMQKMIDHPAITVKLNKKWEAQEQHSFDHVFFTGPIDAYFNYALGKLSYRTVTFERFEAEGDFQGTAQMNYCDENVPYTRIVEFKHFTPWEHHSKTVCFREYSKETGNHDIPYYPRRLSDDKLIFERYRNLALTTKGISFLGRLATYRYLDMHQVIEEALHFASLTLTSLKTNLNIPVFAYTHEG